MLKLSFLSALSLLLSLTAAECVVRYLGGYTEYKLAVERRHLSQKRARQNPVNLRAMRAMQESEKSDILVAALGDSFTFGEGLASFDQSWPHHLEVCLQKKLDSAGVGRRVRVVNLGKNGGDFINELTVLKKLPNLEQYDLVVHQTFFNDFQVRNPDRIPGFPLNAQISRPNFPRDWRFHLRYYIASAVRGHFLKRADYISYLRRWGKSNLKHWKAHAEDLKKLVDYARSKGVDVMTFLAPANLWVNGVTSIAEFEWNILRKTKEYTDYDIIDIAPALHEQIPNAFDHWVASFDGHPDETIYRVYAETLCPLAFKRLQDSKIFATTLIPSPPVALSLSNP